MYPSARNGILTVCRNVGGTVTITKHPSRRSCVASVYLRSVPAVVSRTDVNEFPYGNPVSPLILETYPLVCRQGVPFGLSAVDVARNRGRIDGHADSKSFGKGTRKVRRTSRFRT